MLQSALGARTLLAGRLQNGVELLRLQHYMGSLCAVAKVATHNHSKAGAMACCMWAECTAWPLLPSNGYCRQCSHSWITETGAIARELFSQVAEDIYTWQGQDGRSMQSAIAC